MKRPMTGGAHRGPVALTRQRRTIRFMQILLVAIGLALMVFSVMTVVTFSSTDATGIDAPRATPVGQAVVPGVLGVAALFAARLLQDRDGVRLPTPARLEELVGRAEGAAIARAAQEPAEPPTD